MLLILSSSQYHNVYTNDSIAYANSHVKLI